MDNRESPQILVVAELTVRVVTGETCYPAEDGFSAFWAEVTTGDENLARTLESAGSAGRELLLRCAMLDVTGRVTKHEKTPDGTRFVLSVTSLVSRPSVPATGG